MFADPDHALSHPLDVQELKVPGQNRTRESFLRLLIEGLIYWFRSLVMLHFGAQASGSAKPRDSLAFFMQNDTLLEPPTSSTIDIMTADSYVVLPMYQTPFEVFSSG